MESCKVGLNKAACQAAELLGNISGSMRVRAELITKWRLLSLHQNRWGAGNIYSYSNGCICSLSSYRQSEESIIFVLGKKFLKFISYSLIIAEQYTDNYSYNN